MQEDPGVPDPRQTDPEKPAIPPLARVSPGNGGRRTDWIAEVLDWAKHILIAVLVGLFLVVFVIQRNEVLGSSMEPTLYTGDQLLVEKVSVRFGRIRHGDIVTVNADGLPGHYGEKNIIKRVIGIPGDRIEIRDGRVYRNGVVIEEPYLEENTTVERDPRYSSVVLGEDEYFVLGDHRSVSLDSRTFGPIEESRVVGHVLIRFYPLDGFGAP